MVLQAAAGGGEGSDEFKYYGVLDIIAWDDMICIVGLRYRRWLALT